MGSFPTDYLYLSLVVQTKVGQPTSSIVTLMLFKDKEQVCTGFTCITCKVLFYILYLLFLILVSILYENAVIKSILLFLINSLND